MKIYRYEKMDGGGPYMTQQGQNRFCPICQMDDGYKYGCKTLKDLNNYFINQNDILKDCTIKIYDVPLTEVIFEDRQVKFPKKYNPIK